MTVAFLALEGLLAAGFAAVVVYLVFQVKLRVASDRIAGTEAYLVAARQEANTWREKAWAEREARATAEASASRLSGLEAELAQLRIEFATLVALRSAFKEQAERVPGLEGQIQDLSATVSGLEAKLAEQERAHLENVAALTAVCGENEEDLNNITTDSLRVNQSISPVVGERDDSETARQQVRQLVKLALDAPSADNLEDYLGFTTRFSRLSIWNTWMAHIQRPGARIIASEYEWKRVNRYVLPDAVPIIILWPFSPIRFIYELADTGPPIDRQNIKDPFAVEGEFHDNNLSKLIANLKKEKTFKVEIELRRQGFSYAGSAAVQGILPLPFGGGPIGKFAHENAAASELRQKAFRITLNDRLEPKEQFATLAHEFGHIFCGHLGGCTAQGRDENDESGWPDRRDLGKNEKEIEAEAVAFIVAARARLITSSAKYLRGYVPNAKISAINIDLVVRAASRIERLAKIHYGTMRFRA
jgi:hypothetical protein